MRNLKGNPMNFAIRIPQPLVTLIASVFFILSGLPRSVMAAGVVGNGTAGSCTEVAYDAALAGGGDVTFNCGAAPVTITLSHQTTLTDSTRIDGSGLITLSGNDSTDIFTVNSGVKVALT